MFKFDLKCKVFRYEIINVLYNFYYFAESFSLECRSPYSAIHEKSSQLGLSQNNFFSFPIKFFSFFQIRYCGKISLNTNFEVWTKIKGAIKGLMRYLGNKN